MSEFKIWKWPGFYLILNENEGLVLSKDGVLYDTCNIQCLFDSENEAKITLEFHNEKTKWKIISNTRHDYGFEATNGTHWIDWVNTPSKCWSFWESKETAEKALFNYLESFKKELVLKYQRIEDTMKPTEMVEPPKTYNFTIKPRTFSKQFYIFDEKSGLYLLTNGVIAKNVARLEEFWYYNSKLDADNALVYYNEKVKWQVIPHTKFDGFKVTDGERELGHRHTVDPKATYWASKENAENSLGIYLENFKNQLILKYQNTVPKTAETTPSPAKEVIEPPKTYKFIVKLGASNNGFYIVDEREQTYLLNDGVITAHSFDPTKYYYKYHLAAENALKVYQERQRWKVETSDLGHFFVTDGTFTLNRSGLPIPRNMFTSSNVLDSATGHYNWTFGNLQGVNDGLEKYITNFAAKLDRVKTEEAKEDNTMKVQVEVPKSNLSTKVFSNTNNNYTPESVYFKHGTGFYRNVFGDTLTNGVTLLGLPIGTKITFEVTE